MTPERIIISKICQYYNITVADLMSKNRQHHLSTARFMTYRMLREKLDWVVVRIGEYVNRDHSSVLYGLERVDWLLENDFQFKYDYNIISARIYKGIASAKILPKLGWFGRRWFAISYLLKEYKSLVGKV